MPSCLAAHPKSCPPIACNHLRQVCLGSPPPFLQAVEAQVDMRARMAGLQGRAAVADGGKSVCCLVDGSSNSFEALR